MPDEEPTLRAGSFGGVEGDRTIRLLSAGQRVLGRYLLESVLGQGGMAVVWRARDETLGETVALKFLPEAVARDDAAVDELKEETRRARRLTHPNIVRIHDFVQGPGMAAVSMEFVDGDTLAKRRLEQPGKIFSPATLAPLVAQLCAALDYAHATAKLVHRDLKPANLLVTHDGQLKVADFGIARGLTEANTRLTGKAGQTSGTLLYASPQQLLGEKPSPADDIYALGSSLYELLTGKPPFYRGDPHSLILQVREKAPLTLAAQRAELEIAGEPVPPAWEKAILACLAKKPEDRPQSAGEVAKRLGLAESRAPWPATGSQPSPRKSKNLVPWVSLGIAAVAVLGYFLWPKSNQPPSSPAQVVLQPSPAAVQQPGEFSVTVDPPEAGARLSLGALSDIEVKAGKASVRGAPDGEQELTVRAPGYQVSSTRVMVKAGRGSAEVHLALAKNLLSVKARPGTLVTVTDAQGKASVLGTAGPDGRVVPERYLMPGRHVVRLEHPECAPLELPNIDLVTDLVTELAPAQTLLPGEMRVFSVPAEAEVFVNGQSAGKTPATLKNQPSEQPLAVEVVLRGYRHATQNVTLKPKEVRTLNLGTLTAESGAIRPQVNVRGKAAEVPGIKYFVNGHEMALANGVLDGLEVGERELEARHPDYEVKSQVVTVKDQETTKAAVTLVPKPATLTLTVVGPADYALSANGKPVVVTGGKATLPPGEALALEVQAKGYTSAERRLTLPANGNETLALTLEKVPELRVGQPWTVPNLGLVMQPIAAGTFTMGSENGGPDEKPLTRVTLTKPFWLGKTEVTQREWKNVMGNNPSSFKSDDRPVENVPWTDAMEFCRKLTEREREGGRLQAGFAYTLPTEAQWEYACRAGTTGDYAGNLDDMGWYADKGGATSHPVAQKAPNAWGLYDMHGNVWEWCADWYADKLPGGTVRDSSGPAAGTHRVLRSGGWHSVAFYPRSAARSKEVPGGRISGGVGFRLALCAVQVPGPSVTSGGSPKPGEPWTIPDFGLTLMPIAPGTFTMGSENGGGNENPVTRVTLTKPFWLGKTEVTQREWQAVMGNNPSASKGDEQPVENVSWTDAMEYGRKLTERERNAARLPEGYAYTLPTEAQWEYACRAGTTGDFAGELDTMGWYSANSGDQKHPVAQKRANAWGLYDMHGNVWEWCADWYATKLPGGSVRDPSGPASGSQRVNRGGDWNKDAAHCRSAVRSSYGPGNRNYGLGFRLALVAGQVPGPSVNSAVSPKPGEPWTISGLGLTLMPIAAGTFTMGTEGGFAAEKPTNVTLTQPFWMGRTEVTQREWQALMGNNPSKFKEGNRPVETVSWTEAMEYCRKLTARERAAGRVPEGYAYTLPTEAQWEYACRAGTTGDYAGRLDEMGWYTSNSGNPDTGNHTQPVALKRANAWGLYDMHGNVFEWCADWYENYPGGSLPDYAGAASGTRRVLRGGAFERPAASCRSASRNNNDTDWRSYNLGFRLALSAIQ